MDIKVKGVRKKTRIKWEVSLFTVGDSYTFWRTNKECLNRDYLDRIGIEIKKYGGVTKMLTFGIRDWRKIKI